MGLQIIALQNVVYNLGISLRTTPRYWGADLAEGPCIKPEQHKVGLRGGPRMHGQSLDHQFIGDLRLRSRASGSLLFRENTHVNDAPPVLSTAAILVSWMSWWNHEARSGQQAPTSKCTTRRSSFNNTRYHGLWPRQFRWIMHRLVSSGSPACSKDDRSDLNPFPLIRKNTNNPSLSLVS